ncbi:TPR domain protein, putative component of TonB system [Fimbriiglobus ruber]|uniref:TPR domain protein, putative component of TonB system n=1 Tax=Fimbriiglobus ruber TaxID=1908690 RepID=A0A225DPS0_9BACT|nr:TPR domain protein, putative component of TonB system [Fimbriiglobus ruber]
MGLMAGAVGCTRTETVQPPPPGLPTPQNRPSMLSGMLGPKSNFPQPPAPAPVVALPASKANQPIKPETELAFAVPEVEAAFAEGKSSVERDQLLDSARQRYQRVLATDPKNKTALVGLAHLYTRIGDRDKAIATYKTAVQYHPKDAELAYQFASAEARFGDWAGVAEAATRALALDPENRKYQKTLAYSLAQLGRWQESYAAFVKVMPESQARFYLGRVLIDMNRVDEGKQQIQAALAIDPQYADARQFLEDMTAVPPNAQGPVQQTGFTDPAPAAAVPPAVPGQ